MAKTPASNHESEKVKESKRKPLAVKDEYSNLQFFGNEFTNKIKNIALHTIITITTLISLWIVHIALNFSIGEDAKYFDLIPVRYVVEAGELASLLKWLWHIIKDIKE